MRLKLIRSGRARPLDPSAFADPRPPRDDHRQLSFERRDWVTEVDRTAHAETTPGRPRPFGRKATPILH